MLSPCIRQVTHALLTRPPLKQKSLGFILFPFDLHVLGTPPAFILSQDQTLMFFRSLLPVPSGFRQSLSGFYRLFLSVLLFLWVDLFTDLFSEISLWAPRFQTAFQRLLRFSLFRIFRVALLFICQGSSEHIQMYISERRRRDLNPRAAINDLHPFQGCPFDLLGTSPSK